MGTKATLKQIVKEAEKEAEKEGKMRGETKGGLWEGKRKRLVLNYVKRKGKSDPLPSVFENVAICIACGKEKYVNASGFCQLCWMQFSHLRRKK